MKHDINDMIDDAIKALIDDDVRQGADILFELAVCFHGAGLPIETFYDIRRYIVEQAISKTDALFINEKLKLIERENRDRRNRSAKTSKITKDNTKTLH